MFGKQSGLWISWLEGEKTNKQKTREKTARTHHPTFFLEEEFDYFFSVSAFCIKTEKKIHINFDLKRGFAQIPFF